ncbi:hypothetical protein Aph01nite_81210 [Acrocarpospora phusangensis]|uniref:Uncharacterized protein n=1 Tax=Acrocarpospora phusangensis TaxID=1070424 RepID=A0A919QL96_9ACTN|nr:hypothetical protein [Acrocarpospora phusangensis]GIH29811.1 hypothetical protein Aph01nite_81210 [Acrocarpospora phusangensis]
MENEDPPDLTKSLPIRLHYVRVSPTDLPDGEPIAVHKPGHIYWLVDGSQMAAPLLRPLGLVGDNALSSLAPLSEPTAEPFGELRLVREDIGINELEWTLDKTGFYIPVPKKLISARLVDQMMLGTNEQLRHFRPKEG